LARLGHVSAPVTTQAPDAGQERAVPPSPKRRRLRPEGVTCAARTCVRSARPRGRRGDPVVPVHGPGRHRRDPAATVTVDIARTDGTSLITAGATSGTPDDPRTYALAAGSNTLTDWLTVTWKVGGTARATTVVEVVGDYWASAGTIEAKEPALTSRTVADVIAARVEAEDRG